MKDFYIYDSRVDRRICTVDFNSAYSKTTYELPADKGPEYVRFLWKGFRVTGKNWMLT